MLNLLGVLHDLFAELEHPEDGHDEDHCEEQADYQHTRDHPNALRHHERL